jgi:hypothetical protein
MLILCAISSDFWFSFISLYITSRSARAFRTHTQNDGKSLPYKTKYHTTIENCQMMVDLFKKGIKMLTDISCPYNEITIWTFYMAMAINRLQ